LVIQSLNDQIASEVRPIQLTPSAGGITYRFDPEHGTYTETGSSLGPIVAERPQTLGKGKFSFGMALTYFEYNRFNGTNLDNLSVIARHDNETSPASLTPFDTCTNVAALGCPTYELDTIKINLDVKLKFTTLALGATYGLTDKLDVGIVVPIVHSEMKVNAAASIVPSPDNVLVQRGIFPHKFDPNNGECHDTITDPIAGPCTDSASADATGLGDIYLGAKYYAYAGDKVNLAGALSVKLATGDKNNFLGTGDTNVRPFLIGSARLSDLVTTHANLGYDFDLDDGSKNAITYAAGAEVGGAKLVGVADILGRHEPNGNGNSDLVNLSLGAKWSPVKDTILAANFIVPLNRDSGLRSDLISTVGVELRY
jgi:hypothetical protein